jgi:hypothetical protein
LIPFIRGFRRRAGEKGRKKEGKRDDDDDDDDHVRGGEGAAAARETADRNASSRREGMSQRLIKSGRAPRRETRAPARCRVALVVFASMGKGQQIH